MKKLRITYHTENIRTNMRRTRYAELTVPKGKESTNKQVLKEKLLNGVLMEPGETFKQISYITEA